MPLLSVITACGAQAVQTLLNLCGQAALTAAAGGPAMWRAGVQAVENLLKLCAGADVDGRRLCYQGCPFHRVEKRVGIAGGDVTQQDGSGGHGSSSVGLAPPSPSE
jgi:hypothetical protein